VSSARFLAAHESHLSAFESAGYARRLTSELRESPRQGIVDNRHRGGNMLSKKNLLFAAAALPSMLAPAGAAFAQDKPTESVEEIVVTARKREERLQDVPLAVSVVSSQELENRGSTGLQDLQYSVPGLSAVEYGPGQERVQLRGISNTNGLSTVG